MLDIKKKTQVVEGLTVDSIPLEIIQSKTPLVLKSLVASWPLVKLAKDSDESAASYLNKFYNGRPTLVCQTPPRAKGRMFYNESLTQLDYSAAKGRIDETLELILAGRGEPNAPGYYIASNIVDTHLPGFRAENDLTLPRKLAPHVDREIVSIWIGSNTTATCHYDALDNIACCAAGRRKFTLFPPSQVQNLYPGPLEPTPGGQVISLVDFQNPDFEKFPNFQNALNAAEVAELEPGDALFLPSMWWHHVEALAPFNLLINYWWNDAARYLTSGMNALLLAMLGIRDKPEHEREAWKHLFDYYIFNGAENSNRQIPEQARGYLGELDELTARKLRAFLINKLNR